VTDVPSDDRPRSDTGSRCSRLRRARRFAPVLVLLIVSALTAAVAAPAQASTATSFTVSGRGWGHGIGMSQWGAYGYASHGWTYRQILTHYYTGISLGDVDDLTLRVRLRGGLSAVKVTCAYPYRAQMTGLRFDIPAGATATTTWTGTRFKVAAAGKVAYFTSPVSFVAEKGLLKTLTATDLGTTGRYRGVLRVLRYDGALMLLNRVPLESYLRGVVPREMPAAWPAAAVQAQACAARAYAARAYDPKRVFDLYCDTRSQVYAGVEAEDPRSDRAVLKTAGVVPTYGGTPIHAFYFSTSGGHTESIENVWQTSPVPYLKGVEDEYDDASPLHRWPENPQRRSAAAIADLLGPYSSSNPPGVKGQLRSVYVVKRGVSPRVVRAAVIGSEGVSWISGSQLRFKLDLRDTWVTLRSLSISPAKADGTTLAYGETVTLKGRLYPALPDGATVTVNILRDGVWRTRTLPTTRRTQRLNDTLAAAYSAYSMTLKPGRTTTYYVSRAALRSPRTVVAVRPAVTLQATPTTAKAGQAVAFTGTVAPALSGVTAWLQTKRDGVWSDTRKVPLDGGGTFRVSWAAVAGVSAARLRVPATDSLVAGRSPAVALVVK
jgi:stage II sporulation protein D